MHTHTLDPLSIGCDNASCVALCDWQTAVGVRTVCDTLEMPARRIWSRIWALLRYRRALGTMTETEWVHSHVDIAERAVVVSSVLKCRCSTHNPTTYTQRTGKCDPLHFSHIGNKAADNEVEQGRLSAVLSDVEQPLELGECRCVLANPEGVRADLPMATVLSNRVTHQLLESAAHSP
jgi:hypothetical protein